MPSSGDFVCMKVSYGFGLTDDTLNTAHVNNSGFVFVIKFPSELGKWHSCDCLQRCKKQHMQTRIPGENVSEHHKVSLFCHVQCVTLPLSLCVRSQICPPFSSHQQGRQDPGEKVGYFATVWWCRIAHNCYFLQQNAMCPTRGLAVSFLSIYKMFPADKKRVESALASAHLPKGKVREYQHFSCVLSVRISSCLLISWCLWLLTVIFI